MRYAVTRSTQRAGVGVDMRLWRAMLAAHHPGSSNFTISEGGRELACLSFGNVVRFRIVAIALSSVCYAFLDFG